VTEGALQLETLTTLEQLESLAGEWDDLVRAMPRPSPWLLHAWLTEWWRHYGDRGELAVHVARRDGRLVGALPLWVRSRFGVRIVDFFGHFRAAPVDLLLADGETEAAGALAARAAAGRHDFAELFGLHRESRLAQAVGDDLRLVERVESPVLDLGAGWEDTYRSKTDSKKRNLHKRRRRQLAELGTLETTIARDGPELDEAMQHAFELHARRWEGRPDGSGFATPVGRRFHLAAARALAEQDDARVVTLRLDGKPIAFHYYFAFCGRMFVHRLAFEPSLSRYSPGLVATLDAIEAAAAEGLTLVEYLGGGERYKLELSDRLEPLYEGFGLARSLQGRLMLQSNLAAIEARRHLKRSQRLRKFYFEDLAPLRKVAQSVRARGGR
jgi:CelD/BcsL family acetyltransferase involved in cellulose biosynthesis